MGHVLAADAVAWAEVADSVKEDITGGGEEEEEERGAAWKGDQKICN